LEAVKWYRQAAERGDRESAYKLWFLVWRDGVNFKYQPKSQSPAIPPPKTAIYEEESAKWLRRAAEQGHRESQFWMASQINKNPQEAYFWALLLHTRDKEYAEKVVDVTLRNIDRIKSMLTPEQIAETEERVKKWKPAPVLWPQPDTSE
jgi:TPR repeat protein